MRHVWTDKRLLLALPVAIVLRFLMDWAMFGVFTEGTRVETHDVGLHPTNPQADATAQGDGKPVLLERRIKKINLDGSEAYDPMSPLAAAAAFGGAILLVGGTLSILSWRKAALEEKASHHGSEPDPVVRNAAQSRSGR